MQHTFSDLLCPALVEKVGAPDIRRRAYRHSSASLSRLPQFGHSHTSFPSSSTIFDLTVIAADLTVVALGIQLGIHDVVVDELA
jgi:hypothetical protein